MYYGGSQDDAGFSLAAHRVRSNLTGVMCCNDICPGEIRYEHYMDMYFLVCTRVDDCRCVPAVALGPVARLEAFLSLSLSLYDRPLTSRIPLFPFLYLLLQNSEPSPHASTLNHPAAVPSSFLAHPRISLKQEVSHFGSPLTSKKAPGTRVPHNVPTPASVGRYLQVPIRVESTDLAVIRVAPAQEKKKSKKSGNLQSITTYRSVDLHPAPTLRNRCLQHNPILARHLVRFLQIHNSTKACSHPVSRFSKKGKTKRRNKNKYASWGVRIGPKKPKAFLLRGFVGSCVWEEVF